jgi:hypothetical protein
MELHEFLGGTMNISILAIFYTLFGAFMSYLEYNLFDDYTKEWEKQGPVYQTTDIAIELSFIGITSFWITYFIRDSAPIFPIQKILDHEIDTYISGLFFAFAMFVFLEDLAKKIKHMFEKYFKTYFTRLIPEEWTITKFLFMRKTNPKKDSAEGY